MPGVSAQDDAALTSFLQRGMSPYFHPVGTCRMGSDSRPVTGPELRVRGIQGLRVVDASVMPTIVSGNPNATVIAIAGRAASLIAQ